MKCWSCPERLVCKNTSVRGAPQQWVSLSGSLLYLVQVRKSKLSYLDMCWTNSQLQQRPSREKLVHLLQTAHSWLVERKKMRF